MGTVGCLIALLVTAIVMFVIFNLTYVGRTIFIVTIVFLGLSVALFVFAIYASCKSSRTLRLILAIVFICISLGVIALAAYCLAAKGSILSAFEDLWDEPVSGSSLKSVEALERGFHCCGWSAPRELCQERETKLCNATLEGAFSKKFAPVSAALLAFSAVLLAGCAFGVRTLFVPELPSNVDHDLSASLTGSARNSRVRHYNASAW
jgi:hypothetical protein